MLVGFLITLDVIVCFLLILVVLMQSGKGGVSGAFGIGGASQTIFGAGQAGNVLTTATWYLGGGFLALSFLIALLGGGQGGGRKGVLQPATRPAATQSALPQGGGTNLPPVGSPEAGGSATPAGSIPAGSIPAGSIPAGSIPAGSIPAGSTPAAGAPTPAGTQPATGTPVPAGTTTPPAGGQ